MLTALCFPPDCLQSLVDDLPSLRVVALRPHIPRTAIMVDVVVGVVEMAAGACSHLVQGARFRVGEDRSGEIVARSGFIEVGVDPLELEIG